MPDDVPVDVVYLITVQQVGDGAKISDVAFVS
jgi:hypothetical protein